MTGSFRRSFIRSHSWQNSFGRDGSILGKEIQINGNAFTIIGVAPEQFEGVLAGYPNDLWLPAMMVRVGYRPCDALSNLDCGPLGLIGRLAPNSTPESVQAEASMLTAQLAPMSSKLAERGAKLSSAIGVREQDRERLRFQMQLMIAVTGLLSLIACANVTGLLLAHGVARRKEIAVRLCIGAGRMRLVRQFLTESLLLTLIGGALGVIISLWLKQLLLVYYTTSYTTFRIDYDLSLNPRTLSATGYNRRLDWFTHGVCIDAFDQELALRRRRDRSAHVHGSRAVIDLGRCAGMPHPRTPRNESRSDDCPQI